MHLRHRLNRLEGWIAADLAALPPRPPAATPERWDVLIAAMLRLFPDPEARAVVERVLRLVPFSGRISDLLLGFVQAEEIPEPLKDDFRAFLKPICRDAATRRLAQ